MQRGAVRVSRSSAAQIRFSFEPEDTVAGEAKEPMPVVAGLSKGEQIRSRIAANREKRLQIAEAMKREAGVLAHEFNARREDLSGLAFIGTGRIRSPEGQNIHQLYTVAHECGHIFLHNEAPGMQLPPHVMEMEAESYAHQAFLEHGMRIPHWLSDGGRRYVGSWVEKDRAAGKPIDPRVLAYANGTRSPYEPLRMVPQTWTLHSAAPPLRHRADKMRRSIDRWGRAQPGSLMWTLVDISRNVKRGFFVGMIATFLGGQLWPLSPGDVWPAFAAADVFLIITGGLVGACLVLLRRPIIRRRT